MAFSPKEKEKAKEIIVQEISNGKSLAQILDKNNAKMPCQKTVFNWLNKESNYFDENFLHNYARAQMFRADREFEEILAIADDQENDVYIDPDTGKELTNHNVIQRARLRVDARKWRLAKMQPKKYGDRVDFTSGDKPIGSIPVVLQDGRTYEDLKNDLKPE